MLFTLVTQRSEDLGVAGQSSTEPILFRMRTPSHLRQLPVREVALALGMPLAVVATVALALEDLRSAHPDLIKELVAAVRETRMVHDPKLAKVLSVYGLDGPYSGCPVEVPTAAQHLLWSLGDDPNSEVLTLDDGSQT